MLRNIQLRLKNVALALESVELKLGGLQFGDVGLGQRALLVDLVLQLLDELGVLLLKLLLCLVVPLKKGLNSLDLSFELIVFN